MERVDSLYTEFTDNVEFCSFGKQLLDFFLYLEYDPDVSENVITSARPY